MKAMGVGSVTDRQERKATGWSRWLSLLLLGLPLLAMVYFYRYVISPMIGPRCRFQPTCSEYALDALKLHGPVKGSWLTLKRIGKCHPWGGHGFDPVPKPCCHKPGSSPTDQPTQISPTKT